jgi:anti-sigma28 factor (negative regulator of flagellin synthesis)
MIGVQGIGGVQEPAKPERSSSAKETERVEKTAESSDGLEVSTQGQAAVTVAKVIEASADQPDIRADRVAAAKLAIERGDYKKPEVVEAVAQRINKIL